MSIIACESTTNVLPNYPMGWYSLGLSGDLQVGEVKPASACERELVMYRTRSGKAAVADAYCPHLGAHLGVNGHVKGETLQCPFHGWQFNTDGSCDSIPYCEKIPERAKIHAWPTCELNGEIYFWYHEEGAEPQWEVPEIKQFGDSEWTAPRRVEFEIPAHVQDIAENSCDPVHFEFVHKQPDTPPSTVTIDDDGRTMHLNADFTAEGMTGAHLHSVIHQPGLATVHNSYGPGAEMMLYNTAQPISKTMTRMRWTLSVSKPIEDLAGDQFMEGIIAGLSDDEPIWANKVHKRKPIFCPNDTTLVTYRKWVRQFYIKQYPDS